MLVKLFVGNLPWSVGDEDLAQVFAPHGDVQSARVITDRDTGRSRGFGFVEIEVDDVNTVIRATDGQELNGRPIRVNESEDRDRGSRGGGGGGRGGYGGGGGGGGYGGGGGGGGRGGRGGYGDRY
ncbi:RNA recognition motif domain-containing protein [Candidatus Chloroploca asiatica]|uniref:RNA-binding protein n=1 Tax=Candidatus Chloroploca asiatica TaxID=1506545 RepID=A0A2H3KUZ6_9CHLR|nr:RNA-binding protein [Candidatus Chloroploca asiatica]PDV97697.1 RNA-binding protein [Candidatus Chloroploca asiatica]